MGQPLGNQRLWIFISRTPKNPFRNLKSILGKEKPRKARTNLETGNTQSLSQPHLSRLCTCFGMYPWICSLRHGLTIWRFDSRCFFCNTRCGESIQLKKLCKNIDFVEVVRIGSQQSDCSFLPPDSHRMMGEGTPFYEHLMPCSQGKIIINCCFWWWFFGGNNMHGSRVLQGFARFCALRLWQTAFRIC